VLGGTVAGHLGYAAALALGAGTTALGLVIFVTATLRRWPAVASPPGLADGTPGR
jgi:hypothetical protein